MPLRTRALSVLYALAFAVVAMAATAFAQSPPQTPAATASQSVEGARKSLDRIREMLADPRLSDATLQDLRGKIVPLARQIQAVINDLAPRTAEIQTRLAQLGPKPDGKAPPENPSVTAERESQQKLYDSIDGVLKQARLLGVEIDQTSATIVDRRRALFARALFARSKSVLSPDLWNTVVDETPRDAQAMAAIGSAWLSEFTARLEGWRLASFLAALAALASLCVVAARIERRVLEREKAKEPTRLQKALAALWIGAVTAIVPIASMMALAGLLRAFTFVDPSLDPLIGTIFDGITRVALAVGLARGLFAPSRSNWRLIDIGDATAESLLRLSVLVVAIVSLTKILDAMNDLIAASLPVSVALRGLSSLAVALVGVATLRHLVDVRDERDAHYAKAGVERDWHAPTRLAAWLAVAVIIGAALVGYIAFAAFLIDQIIWTAFIGCGLFLLLRLADDGIAAALEPHAPIGRIMISSVGVRRESLGRAATLLSGAANVVLPIAALLLALAPWGVDSDDMFGSLRAAYFGFVVGGVTISLSGIVTALALFVAILLATRAAQRWLEVKFLPQTQLDLGLRSSIKTSFGYIGFLVAIAAALGHLGLTFDQLAIVAGALSVGIGFGLQSIVNNFVSGLILLWERAIRVGDWVVVGEEQGYVKRINVRATEIETFDRATMIVPNSNLISGVVKNWVSGDKVGRIRVMVPVNLVADPEQVREVLVACAKAHDLVIKIPAPQAIFSAMTETGLKFELICYVGDVETALRVKSDLHFEIFKRFKEIGISIAPPVAPPPVLTVAGFEELGEILTTHFHQDDVPRRLATK